MKRSDLGCQGKHEGKVMPLVNKLDPMTFHIYFALFTWKNDNFRISDVVQFRKPICVKLEVTRRKKSKIQKIAFPNEKTFWLLQQKQPAMLFLACCCNTRAGYCVGKWIHTIVWQNFHSILAYLHHFLRLNLWQRFLVFYPEKTITF